MDVETFFASYEYLFDEKELYYRFQSFHYDSPVLHTYLSLCLSLCIENKMSGHIQVKKIIIYINLH